MLNKKVTKVILLSTAFILVIAGLALAKTDHREYKNSRLDDCKDCHNGAAVVGNHGGSREHRLLAQRASKNCTDCHQQSFCLDCHNGGNVEPYLQKSLSRTGETMPTTHRSDFISIHAIKAKDDPQNCYRCHEVRFCTDCHARIPNKGSMSIKSHTAVGTTQRYFLTRTSPPADIALHASEARRNLQSCEGCHPDAVVCSQCHNLSAGGRVFKSAGTP
jgi:membrane protease subunit (stomatin/prohibitin family)